MQRYILFRFLQAVITVFIISIVVFLLGRATGDPVLMLLAPDAPKEQYDLVRHELGLDQPLLNQYGIWLGKILQGDWGTSIRSGQPVITMILERLPNTLQLASIAMAWAVLLGAILGVISAVGRDSVVDTLAKATAFVGMATPHFWLGIMLILLFSVWLRWLPTSGMGSPLHYLMPTFTLGFGSMLAGVLRLTRSSMLDVLDAEYVKLARIKGLSGRQVLWVHALRNGLIPVVAYLSIYFSLMMSGAVVVETVFRWPGVGMLAYQAVIWRDFPLLQGLMVLIAAWVLAVNLVVDILYGYIDPRIRY